MTECECDCQCDDPCCVEDPNRLDNPDYYRNGCHLSSEQRRVWGLLDGE